jgi:hypothetical protein
MIRRGHYSSNNFQDSTKRKSTGNKTLGYLPRVLFFNAFELSAERGTLCRVKLKLVPAQVVEGFCQVAD